MTTLSSWLELLKGRGSVRKEIVLPPFDVESLGFLDPPTIAEGGLLLEGCAGSTVAPLEGLEVRVDGQVVAAQSELCLPRSVVDRGWGRLMGADRAGFRVRADVERGRRNSLVSVVPLFEGRRGVAMLWTRELSLPLPPDEFQTGIGGYFLPVAFEFLGHCVQRAGLQQAAAILDAGCGVGRMAFALSAYLGPAARYQGFDIVGKWIDWCQAEITKRDRRFQFAQVPVHNRHYNPEGDVAPADFAFPYPDRAFDFAIATSLFTHLRPDAAQNYVTQIGRVLRPGGRCLSTWFLLDEESRRLVSAGQTSHHFTHDLGGGAMTSRPDDPEYAIAFDEALVRRWHAANGLRILARLPGLWCWRPSFVSFQDILITEKLVQA